MEETAVLFPNDMKTLGVNFPSTESLEGTFPHINILSTHFACIDKSESGGKMRAKIRHLLLDTTIRRFQNVCL